MWCYAVHVILPRTSSRRVPWRTTKRSRYGSQIRNPGSARCVSGSPCKQPTEEDGRSWNTLTKTLGMTTKTSRAPITKGKGRIISKMCLPSYVGISKNMTEKRREEPKCAKSLNVLHLIDIFRCCLSVRYCYWLVLLLYLKACHENFT